MHVDSMGENIARLLSFLDILGLLNAILPKRLYRISCSGRLYGAPKEIVKAITLEILSNGILY